MRRHSASLPVSAVLVVAALALPAVAIAASITYNDTVMKGKPVSVTVTTHHAASFHVLLHVRTVGRTQLFLLGKHAPNGGPVIDTKTYACDGAAGSFYCKAAYEPLPAGTYTWKIVRVSGAKEPVTLTLKW
ncbi:MAG: hypothetical protein E6G14_05010 [Actinobacteria bacterium]|nr:MAG: hypothetical protein E6G14_05010 [Actinomycetota bacterium]